MKLSTKALEAAIREYCSASRMPSDFDPVKWFRSQTLLQEKLTRLSAPQAMTLIIDTLELDPIYRRALARGLNAQSTD